MSLPIEVIDKINDFRIGIKSYYKNIVSNMIKEITILNGIV